MLYWFSMGKKKTQLDGAQTAHAVFQQFLAKADPQATNGKNPAAVMLGRAGGLKSGKARMEKMTAKERTEVARNAAKKRWEKKR